MIDGPFALAVAAGMAATVNPCGFALLPAYLAAFLGEDHQPGVGAVPRAFAVSGVLTAGFVVVFGLFGAAISPLAVSVERYLPWATIVIGVALVGLGIALLAGRQIVLHTPKLDKGGRDGGLASMFLFGVSYAVASLSCTIGPFLAVTSSTFGSGDIVSDVGVFIAYALGMGAVVTALTTRSSSSALGVGVTETLADGRARRVGDLAAELDVSQPTVSDAITTLDKRGLVDRHRDPDDLRSTRVTLTDNGAMVASDIAAELRPLLGACSGTAAEQATTLRVLLGEIARLQEAGVITVNRSCLTCHHYQPPGARSPARCLLLGTALRDQDLRVDCPEHEPATL